ncbi:MAG TPA: hypothetical protein VHC45_16105 [Gaiellaceae bacterium]|jgi:hypothetical protein|nr:hypothetical protein [Gaiellaceae bacterium]
MSKSRSSVGSRRAAGAAAAFAALVTTTFAPSALGAGHKDSSSLGYAGPGGKQASIQPPTAAPAGAQASKDNGTLPYTGADIALVGGAGIVLIGFGVGIHALSRRPKHDG